MQGSIQYFGQLLGRLERAAMELDDTGTRESCGGRVWCVCGLLLAPCACVCGLPLALCGALYPPCGRPTLTRKITVSDRSSPLGPLQTQGEQGGLFCGLRAGGQRGTILKSTNTIDDFVGEILLRGIS